ncbi:uncharacterized protein A1O5_10761 [Cladophialophora psammophila CBS 110553]|uniref:Uncharacterized protein n=1 Tax=Cladophialophora psammophila CBS 110553 TaxID=1182543 RepID=W9WNA6_9EURO|nr:uncharacterized protein A1O5_10761 [Cladophialophora psammophila CBS 110553]EXJ66146.1 hypothetical protein A1O5_10761 [Cladophialophora psammophila CBS 110553]
MDGKQLIDAELEQLEIEQRQLDLDRKRLELRLRCATLCSQVEAVADGGQAAVKPEPVGDGTAVGRIVAGDEPSSDPRLGEATSAPTVGDRHVMREEVGPLLHPVERVGVAAHLSGGNHSGATGSFDSETNSAPGAKQVKTWTKDREAERKQSKRQPKVQRLPERYSSAIIRKYGERLVQRHMQSFRRHERWEADQIILAGSKIVDGLLEKRFKSLEELHDEYDQQIRLRCTSSVQEPLINELQKFRRAAPIWWRKCVKKRTQGERFEDATAVFEDVKEGIFD